MFKRLLWLLLGAGFGFGVSFWVVRTVRQTVERYTPERISSDLAGAVRAFGADLRAAASEGREAMLEREAEIRSGLASERGPAGPGLGAIRERADEIRAELNWPRDKP